MELTTRHIGSAGGNPASIIELTIAFNGGDHTEDITNNNKMVDYSLIENLREVADELEEHNQKVANQTKF